MSKLTPQRVLDYIERAELKWIFKTDTYPHGYKVNFEGFTAILTRGHNRYADGNHYFGPMYELHVYKSKLPMLHWFYVPGIHNGNHILETKYEQLKEAEEKNRKQENKDRLDFLEEVISRGEPC